MKKKLDDMKWSRNKDEVARRKAREEDDEQARSQDDSQDQDEDEL